MVQKTEQERLQVALDAAEMGTFVWSAREDRGEPDARMLELFALPSDGVLSLATALDSMIHPEDRQRYGTAVAAAFDPGGSRLLSQEIRVDRGDGSYRWVMVTARAYFEGDPPRPDRLVGVAADISRRREIEDALRESEARFRQVVEVTPQLIWVARPDGAVEMLNPSWSTLIGGTPHTADTDRALLGGAVHPGERDGFLAAWDGHRDPPAVFECEARLRHRDGGHHWYLIRVVPFQDDSGDLVRWFGVATDIDAQRRVGELALAEQTRARDEEHRIALELQRALLPARTVAPPGVSIAARYEAGSATLEVGGDWYDTFELRGGTVALTVGDVVGHGLAAATAMGKMRVAMGALAPHVPGPGTLLTHLDGFVAVNDEIPFATACYAVFDPATRELRHASAGHPPMLVVTAGGDARWLDDGRSAPITGRDFGSRPQASDTLEPGALLVLFSDGLVERRREPITTGLDRLRDATVALRHAPVGEVCDGLLTALGVAEHRNDDVVVLCLRVPPAPFHQTMVADRHGLSRLRHALSAWQRTLPGLDRNDDDLLITVNEACANAIEHAYREDPTGTIEIDVRYEPDGSYLATVRDHGTWRTPGEAGTSRGRGLPIIDTLSHDFERHSTADGTLVRFRVPTREASR
ncbi:SpoIIE family protein phosphatase [Actinoplanes sp. NBRC 101535]|uniref:SpoIIE family protein phosphatase n=1 Tax=Actinoplanes sp. NBRC 101535 TaxID=3032196 RepID=UPI0024A3F866|nr:SpoIIE family protein phosphatase [Actinoplanes sp. NBRC 101535]GLY05063.1 hypothetical protein Acsp01_54420 [Actinoplanes sp. NBRC 101535]